MTVPDCKNDFSRVRAVAFRCVFSACFAALLSGCPLFVRDDPVDFLSNPISRAFAGRLTYPTGEGPFYSLAGDLTRSGLLDILTLNWTSGTLSVLLAAGDSGYAEPVDYDVGATPRAAALADLSGNGVLDIAIVNEDQSQVTLLFGDGAGGFDGSTLIPLAGGAAPRDVIAADLNNDGVMDLAIATTQAETVTIIPGEGGGNFLEPFIVSVGHKPWSLCVADFSGNGVPDIITANPETNTLSLLEGTGAGYLSAQYLPCGNMPSLIRTADLNRDGQPDLVIGNAGSGDISTLLGLGGGAFSDERRFAFPYPAGRFVVADLNGNTLPDIAVVLFNKTGDDRQPVNRFAVAHGDGVGLFRTAVLYGSGWGALDIAAADMNGNGRQDLITADFSNNAVSVAYNRGNGLFESDMRYLLAPGLGAAVLADFTQNGRTDMAVSNRSTNTITVLVNRDGHVFEALPPVMLHAKPLAMATGDLNGNGKLDLVVSLSLHRHLMLFLASGNGLFLPAATLPIHASAEGAFPEVLSLALGDVNGDGKLDIVTGNSGRNSVSVLLNEGNGAFQAPITTWVGNYPLNVHLTDANGNGTLDLVFLSTRNPQASGDASEPRVVRWFGNGDGAFDFDSHTRFATGGGPAMLAMADLSGNGRLDAVTVHPGDNSVYLLGGLNNGNFKKADRLHIGDTPVAVALADINRNSRGDLIVPLATGSVILRYSRGDLKFEGPNNFIVSKGITQALTADLNGDGYADVATVNSAMGDVGVLFGRNP